MKYIFFVLILLPVPSVYASDSIVIPIFTRDSGGNVELGPNTHEPFQDYKSSYANDAKSNDTPFIEMEITHNVNSSPPPKGKPLIKEKHLTKESADRTEKATRIERPDIHASKKETEDELRNAYRTGEKEKYFEKFASLDEAKTQFDKDQDALNSKIKNKNEKLTDAGKKLINIINNAATEHNDRVQELVASISDINEVAGSLQHSFKSPIESQLGGELHKASQYVEIAAKYGNTEYINQTELISLANAAIKLADEALLEGNTDEASIYIEASNALADLALGVIPGVGWAKDVYEATTGKSLVSGKELDIEDRVSAALGAASAGTLSKAKTVFKTIEKLSKGNKSFIPIALKTRELIEQIVSPEGKKLISAGTFGHVVFGDFKRSSDTGGYIITGGLHTTTGLEQFLELNKKAGHNYNLMDVSDFPTPAISSGNDILRKTYSNGVVALQFPRTVFNAKSYKSVDGYKGVKTLWPDGFNSEDYADALKKAINSEEGKKLIKLTEADPKLAETIKGIYVKDTAIVKYEVRVKQGQVTTFFPTMKQ